MIQGALGPTAHMMASKDDTNDIPGATNAANESPVFARGSSSWADVLPKTNHVELFRGTDFGATTLGPMSEWGPALRSYATMVFTDSRAANVYWGPDRIAFYNEDFAPLLAEAHPSMMGKALKVGLPSAWEQTNSIFNQAVATGRTVDLHDISFFLVRQEVLVGT